MKKIYIKKKLVMICLIVMVSVVIVGVGLYIGFKYIDNQTLLSSQNDVVDIAKIINNNFSITDEEVSYLEKLTFDEMEKDPINTRLMNTVSGVKLNDKIRNIYIIVPLTDEEIKYTTDEETSEFFGYEIGTKLNGMWLLNGKFDDEGQLQVSSRDDIYRYLELGDSDIKAFESRESSGLVTQDAWGEFITGYTPIYSLEGNFIGILGVDMDISVYSANASDFAMSIVYVIVFMLLALVVLFIIFFIKYSKLKDNILYNEFYSRLSHDMRTPMNGILGIAKLSHDEQNPQILHENIDKMEESGEYLLCLINDSLEFQKMRNNKLSIYPTAVESRGIIKDIENMVTETARNKGIDFEVKVIAEKIDDYIMADGVRLKQVFVNLLSNAIKFTMQGGRVECLIDVSSRDGNIAHNVITISDTGTGMSKDFLNNKIFRPFSQENNSEAGKYAGTGLGLSIVKNLVELMNGRIEVESVLGKGTTFRVYLDFVIVDNAEAEKLMTDKENHSQMDLSVLKGKHILLVEDNKLNAEIATKLLEKKACIITWVDNGKKAVDTFNQSPVNEFDAILMDIRMPVMDGLDATRNIRKLDRKDARTIPIIAMTANTSDSDVRQCLEAGMNSYIFKPIDPVNMYEEIGKRMA